MAKKNKVEQSTKQYKVKASRYETVQRIYKKGDTIVLNENGAKYLRTQNIIE